MQALVRRELKWHWPRQWRNGDFSYNHGAVVLDIKDVQNVRLLSPHLRLWSSMLYMAIKDLWSKDPDISRSARDYIYKDDQSAANSFDNIMDALGHNPVRFRELMLKPDARKRIHRIFIGEEGFKRQVHRVQKKSQSNVRHSVPSKKKG